jgi:hypothetical protein
MEKVSLDGHHLAHLLASTLEASGKSSLHYKYQDL